MSSEEFGFNKKRAWTSSELDKQMKPTSKELRYRQKKLQGENLMTKYPRYFKCTKCDLSFKSLTENIDKIGVHSCLQVLFCKDCLHFYEDGEFSVDSEGEEKYCRWCGQGGIIYSCSKCISGFCISCVKKHFGTKYNGQVSRNNNWECFLCFPKPLWFLRLICSFAIKEMNQRRYIPSPTSEETNVSIKSENLQLKQDIDEVSSNWDSSAVRKSYVTDSVTSYSGVVSETKHSSSDAMVTDTSFSKRRAKRKRRIHSSTDESDEILCNQNMKKVKLREDAGSNSNEQLNNKSFLSTEIMEKLEKILRLAEYQMAFGVSWSSKMLTKLYKPNFVNSPQELKNECQKIKWFFSILSTYLVESCSSVDLIEKSVGNNDQKLIPSPDKTHHGDYSTVVKFLDFVTNQVKVFLEKGINLQDLLEGEIYYDSQIIGVKIRSNPTPGTSGHQALTPTSEVKSNENKMIDCKISGEKTSDEESIVPSLEIEIDGGRDSSETDNSTSKGPHFSNQIPDYLEDAEGNKMKIQEILSILENA